MWLVAEIPCSCAVVLADLSVRFVAFTCHVQGFSPAHLDFCNSFIKKFSFRKQMCVCSSFYNYDLKKI